LPGENARELHRAAGQTAVEQRFACSQHHRHDRHGDLVEQPCIRELGADVPAADDPQVAVAA
jgi:hypothetical protein